MRWFKLALILIYVFALSGPEAQAQSGLLLGLGRTCLSGECETPYRTLWIAPQRGTVQITELPDLIVPRSSGFWRIGVRTYCNQEVLETPFGHPATSLVDVWFAEPVGKQPVVSGLIPCPALPSCGTDSVSVMFVNANYISLQEGDGGDCGTHPDWSGDWTVRPLVEHNATPLAYNTIEGLGASDEYQRAAAHALLENYSSGAGPPLGESDSEDDQKLREDNPRWSSMTDVEKVAAAQTDGGCFPEHNDKDWYIARDKGRWVADGAFSTHRLCGVLVDFAIPFHPPFASSATVAISLNDIAKQVPDAFDAFWSPDREMVVVFAGKISHDYPGETGGTSIEVFSPRGQNLGKPIAKMPLNRLEGPVMAEWATGANAARWSTELTIIKAQGAIKPLLTTSSQE